MLRTKLSFVSNGASKTGAYVIFSLEDAVPSGVQKGVIGLKQKRSTKQKAETQGHAQAKG